MKLRSLMNNPNGDNYNENEKNHLDGKKVVYGQVVEISKEYEKLPQLKTLIKLGMVEVFIEPIVEK